MPDRAIEVATPGLGAKDLTSATVGASRIRVVNGTSVNTMGRLVRGYSFGSPLHPAGPPESAVTDQRNVLFCVRVAHKVFEDS